jgi:hypothetical protein
LGHSLEGVGTVFDEINEKAVVEANGGSQPEVEQAKTDVQIIEKR